MALARCARTTRAVRTPLGWADVDADADAITGHSMYSNVHCLQVALLFKRLNAAKLGKPVSLSILVQTCSAQFRNLVFSLSLSNSNSHFASRARGPVDFN
jgi:hypothetical protein